MFCVLMEQNIYLQLKVFLVLATGAYENDGE